ncbi:hypothetical protein D9613_004526 [Agrocybe pediades]|uniref:Uncharacterized protein n=1 Tax=Agrocybe pediades TaxID=84607 RepID=A0A8H4VJN7_9AGAR|nr:hypothetical protein D9613_004526 [Agrocybe pediades]
MVFRSGYVGPAASANFNALWRKARPTLTLLKPSVRAVGMTCSSPCYVDEATSVLARSMYCAAQETSYLTRRFQLPAGAAPCFLYLVLHSKRPIAWLKDVSMQSLFGRKVKSDSRQFWMPRAAFLQHE